MTPARPPLVARWLLRLRPLGHHRPDIEADLNDLFAARLAERGAGYAKRRYFVDVLSLWLHRQPAVEGEGMTRLGGRRSWPLEGVTDDVRFACRLFRRQAGTVSIAVAGLAVAIALATIVFSVFSTFNLRPLGVADPEAVVIVSKTVVSTSGASRSVNSWTPAEYLRLRELTRLMTLEASTPARVAIGDPSESASAPANVTFVSGTLVSTFGGRTIVGRAVDPSDDRPGAPVVATLHHEFWKRRFHGDPSVVGRTVLIEGVQVTVVGVFDRSFTGPFRTTRANAALLPLSAAPAISWLPSHAAELQSVEFVGRLNRPATGAQAESEVSGIARSLGIMQTGSMGAPAMPVRVRTVRDEVTGDDVVMLSVFMTIIVLVLILAATNVANLLLASATARQHEIGARLALGANRGRIARQLLTESLVLGAAAGAVAMVITTWMTPIAASLAQIEPEVDFRVDWRVSAFVGCLSILAGLIAGLAPARFGAAGNALGALKGGTPQAGGAPRAARTRAIFLGAQAAMSLVLLVMTSLAIRGLVQVSTMSRDFELDRLVNITGSLGNSRVPDEQFWPLAVARLRSMPGVDAAALVQTPPFMNAFRNARPKRDAPGLPVGWNEAAPDYFDVVGFRVVRGRLYTAEESASKAPVAVITSNVAQVYWPNEDAVGATLERVAGEKFSHVRVIGVVIDPAPRVSPQAGIIFRPIADWRSTRVVVVIAEGASLEQMRSALMAIDPARRPVLQFVRDMRDRQLLMPRALAAIGGVFGGLALLLAVIGVTGVTAFVVAQRRREIGIRMAIGATRADVIRGVIVQGLRPVAIGLAVGFVVAFLAAPLVRQAMYGGISERDPLAFGAGVAVLLGSALCAMWVPARRAARTDPARVLKEQ
jgi:predicted permease